MNLFFKNYSAEPEQSLNMGQMIMGNVYACNITNNDSSSSVESVKAHEPGGTLLPK